MSGSSVKDAGVDVGVGTPGESFKKIENQFGLQIAHQTGFDFGINDRRSSPGEIHCRQPQSLIHRHDKISRAQNTFLVSQCMSKCLSEHDAHIFDCVVLVDIQVSGSFEFKVESAVMSKQ